MRRCSMSRSPAVRSRRASASLCAETEEQRADVAARPRRRRSQTAPTSRSATARPTRPAPMRPPGRSTRRISRSACSGSGMYIRPSAHSATSKPASGRSSCSASMRAKRDVATGRAPCARCRAASTIASGQVDAQHARRPAPTARAAASATSPVPQATSSTRSPGASCGLRQQRRPARRRAAPATAARSRRAARSQP